MCVGRRSTHRPPVPQHPPPLCSLKVLHAQKKLQQAEVTLTRSLVVLREQLGTWNSATLQCITTLGMCKEDMGMLDEVSAVGDEVQCGWDLSGGGWGGGGLARCPLGVNI